MCGLVGVLGLPRYQNRKLFEELLLLDTLRGEDSTGVILVRDNNIFTQKAVGLPPMVIRSPKYRAKVDKNEYKFDTWLGHNRFATKGKVNKRNAHPFQHGHITGMHNGTLTHMVPAAEGMNINFTTDSEGIIHSIAHRGIEETWKRHVANNGAAALLWYDSKEKSTNLITNGKRSLFFAFNKEEDQYLIASEAWMIQAVCLRSNIKLESMIAPKDNVHWKFIFNPEEKRVIAHGQHLKPFVAVYQHPASTTLPFQNRNVNQTYPPYNKGGNQGGGNNKTSESGTPPKTTNQSAGRSSVDKGMVPSSDKGREEHSLARKQSLVVYSGKKTYRVSTDKNGKTRAVLIPAKNITDSGGESEGKTKRSEKLNEVLGKLQSKVMAKSDFEKTFERCCFCGDHHSLDYDSSVIIDSRNAACFSCIDAIIEIGGDPLASAAQFLNQ